MPLSWNFYAYQLIQVRASTPDYKEKFRFLLFQLIILLSSLSFIPHPPMPYMLSEPVDVVHLV